MPNITALFTDGFHFRIYSNDVLVGEFPLSAVSGPPSHSVVMDPATNLPAIGNIPDEGSRGGGLPAGDRGDILWHDGTAWQVLTPDAVNGHVLTESVTDDVLTLEWAAGTGGGGGELTLAQRQCGAARRLSQQIQIAYNWIREQLIATLQAWLKMATTLDEIVGLVGNLIPLNIFKGWDADGNPVSFFSFNPAQLIINAGNAWISGDITAACRSLEPLTPGQVDGIAAAVWCALQSTSDVTISGIIDLVSANIAAYPNWITKDQPMVIEWALVVLTDEWDLFAHQGAADGSNSCAYWDCSMFSGGL